MPKFKRKSKLKTFVVTYKCFRKGCGVTIIKEGTNNMYNHSVLKCPFCGHDSYAVAIKNPELLEKYYQEKEYKEEESYNKRETN